MTLGQAKERTIKLLGEYSLQGARLGETADNADWRLRMTELLDDAQRTAAELRPVFKRREIAHYPPRNRARTGSDIMIHTDGDLIVEAADVRAYTFRVMGSFTVYVEQSGELRWQTVRTISGSTGEGFARYCGRMEGSARRLRLRFAGAYRYLVRDVALYAENFATDAEVPADPKAVWYAAPEDYYRFGRVLRDGRPCDDFRWYLDGNMSIPSGELGMYVLEYGAYPAAVGTDTPDETELEVDESCQRLLPYYAAGMLLCEEDPDAADRLLEVWKTGLEKLQRVQGARQNTVRCREGTAKRRGIQ